MRKQLIASALLLLFAGHEALGQANIRPDPTPRLPAQPGQGLGVEDRQFIVRAANLSEAEVEAGKLGAEKASTPALKELSRQLAAEHQKLLGEVRELAQKNRVNVEPHASKAEWQGALQRLRELSGAEFDKEYLRWQLQAHLAMADLYQAQASNTPQSDLAKFAIVTLAEVQRHFDRAKQLGSEHGVAIDTVRQPPQY